MHLNRNYCSVVLLLSRYIEFLLQLWIEKGEVPKRIQSENVNPWKSLWKQLYRNSKPGNVTGFFFEEKKENRQNFILIILSNSNYESMLNS